MMRTMSWKWNHNVASIFSEKLWGWLFYLYSYCCVVTFEFFLTYCQLVLAFWEVSVSLPVWMSRLHVAVSLEIQRLWHHRCVVHYLSSANCSFWCISSLHYFQFVPSAFSPSLLGLSNHWLSKDRVLWDWLAINHSSSLTMDDCTWQRTTMLQGEWALAGDCPWHMASCSLIS